MCFSVLQIFLDTRLRTIQNYKYSEREKDFLYQFYFLYISVLFINVGATVQGDDAAGGDFKVFLSLLLL